MKLDMLRKGGMENLALTGKMEEKQRKDESNSDSSISREWWQCQHLVIWRQDEDNLANSGQTIPKTELTWCLSCHGPDLSVDPPSRQEEEASRQNDDHHRRAVHHLLGSVPHGPHALRLL